MVVFRRNRQGQQRGGGGGLPAILEKIFGTIRNKLEQDTKDTFHRQTSRHISLTSLCVPCIGLCACCIGLHRQHLMIPQPMTMTMTLHALLRVAAASLLTLQLSNAYAPLAGITARSVNSLEDVELSSFASTPAAKGEKCMLVLGTYAADFNAIEYTQRYVIIRLFLLASSSHNVIIYLPIISLSRTDCDTTCPTCRSEVSRKSGSY